VVSIEAYLDLIPVRDTDHRVWDIVMGTYLSPSEASVKDVIRKDSNGVALLTMRKNCEDEVRERIGNLTLAEEAYNELKKAYEGKTATEFHALLDSLTLVYDDRKSTIEEHITAYERIWNMFVGVMSRADLNSGDGFGRGLKEFSKSDKAKAESLLKSLPSFYANTVENIRAKDHEYDDVARKLKEYILQRQKWRKKEGTQENPIVLKTEAQKDRNDNGKRCNYCIDTKGWKGIGHTESEYFTKKREEKRAVKKGKTRENDTSNGTLILKMQSHSIQEQGS
jgi:hypothetical protein